MYGSAPCPDELIALQMRINWLFISYDNRKGVGNQEKAFKKEGRAEWNSGSRNLEGGIGGDPYFKTKKRYSFYFCFAAVKEQMKALEAL